MALIANDIVVHFGATQILHGVDFSASAGTFAAIIGPNGSGKTTLLRAMTGEISYSGTVQINGQNTHSIRPESLAKERAVLAQSTQLAFPFTVLEVVRLGLTAGVATGDPTDAADLPFQALVRVGLEGFEGRFYSELSGGEKQRNEIMQMALLQPTLAVLDETDSGLDIDALRVVSDGVNALRSPDRAFLVITHYQRLLDYIKPDQVHVLADGKIVRSGGPELAHELEERGYAHLLEAA